MAGSLVLGERRSGFLADKWESHEALATLERERGDVDAAFQLSERMRAFQTMELMARGRVTRGTADSASVAREQDLRLRIAELTRRLESEERGAGSLRGPELSSASSGVTREALARAQQEYARVLLELRESAAGTPVTESAIDSWRPVSARLAPRQAMLAYLVTDSTTLLFVITHDTAHAIDLGLSRQALTRLVDFTRGTLQRPSSESAWRSPLRRLHQQLVTPAEAAGMLSGVRELIVVPHAELHYLSFAAFLGPGPKDEFLVERYDISYAPSATKWLALSERVPPSRARVLAMAPRTKELPASAEEVDAIRALYGRDAMVLKDASATEWRFRLLAARGGFDVLHLATYGVLNQHNPLFSFVDMARGAGDDGRLEVHEVFGLSLDAFLVVLSACQTALGSGTVSDVPAGDDWVGLLRGFLASGASNVIATLWAVEDRSTAATMERLYQGLRAGSPPRAALAAAQRDMLRNPATAGPFHWAGFVLTGGR
jgi:CHAT domain-containing protein